MKVFEIWGKIKDGLTETDVLYNFFFNRNFDTEFDISFVGTIGGER